MSDNAEIVRDYFARDDKHSPFQTPRLQDARAALDALVAERDEARIALKSLRIRLAEMVGGIDAVLSDPPPPPLPPVVKKPGRHP